MENAMYETHVMHVMRSVMHVMPKGRGDAEVAEVAET